MFQDKLSKTCYNNEVQTVGIAGSSAEIVSSFWSDEPQAVILVDDASTAPTSPGPGAQKTRYKLQNFVVTASSIPRLKQTLQNLKTSPWWNHMASFLITDESSLLDQGCSNVFKILFTAWKMHLLHAKVICHHESKGPLIYSYNPYTNQAPLPWEMVKTYRIRNNHPWTLLVRGYQDSQEICKDLDFDKTNDLGGYETRLSIFSQDIDKNLSNINIGNVKSLDNILIEYIFRALNSSMKIFADEPSKILRLTISGFTDMSLNFWYLQNNLNASMTYPHYLSGVVSITQRRGYLSQIGKLVHVLDSSSRYAVLIVCFVTFLFFKFFVRQSVTSAILTIVRLICNAAVPNLPNNVVTRLYLSGLFIFVVTLQGIYQSKLASLLTKQVALPNVATLKDLENYNYVIYGHKDFTLYLKDLNFSGEIVSLEDFKCREYVLKDHRAACIAEWLYSFESAHDVNLHLSSDKLVKMYLVYFIREDWPLEKKVNTVISRIFEADIFHRVYINRFDLTLNKIEFDEKEKDKQMFKIITLNELVFAFAILGIGLACSTVIFTIEMLMQ